MFQDSATLYSFTIQTGVEGILPILKKTLSGTFANRRITAVNLPSSIVLMDAFNMGSLSQVVYGSKEDSLRSNQQLYCIDFIVPDNEKENIRQLYIEELSRHLPVKGTVQRKSVSCYTLRPISGRSVSIIPSEKPINDFHSMVLHFMGREFLSKLLSITSKTN